MPANPAGRAGTDTPLPGPKAAPGTAAPAPERTEHGRHRPPSRFRRSHEGPRRRHPAARRPAGPERFQCRLARRLARSVPVSRRRGRPRRQDRRDRDRPPAENAGLRPRPRLEQQCGPSPDACVLDEDRGSQEARLHDPLGLLRLHGGEIPPRHGPARMAPGPPGPLLYRRPPRRRFDLRVSRHRHHGMVQALDAGAHRRQLPGRIPRLHRGRPHHRGQQLLPAACAAGHTRSAEDVAACLVETRKLIAALPTPLRHPGGPHPERSPDSKSFTADFMRLEDGRFLYLEGGPPFSRNGGGHPCCFEHFDNWTDGAAFHLSGVPVALGAAPPEESR